MRCIEIWGADADGTIPRGRGSRRRDDHTFTGYGRSYTTDEGRYEFWTRNPGSVDGEAPFFAVIVFARGLPDKLHTRAYLPEDEARLAADPLLASLDEGERATLIASRDGRRRPALRHPAAGRGRDGLPGVLTVRGPVPESSRSVHRAGSSGSLDNEGRVPG